MKKHRIGLIGLGMAIKPHLESLHDLRDRVETGAAYARTQNTREKFSREHGIPAVENVDGIFNDQSIDSVLIMTPPWTHLELTQAAAAAGKHVLLEKPLDVNAFRAAQSVEACEKAGVVFGVVFQHRFRPATRELRGLLQSNALGNLLSASATIRWWRSPEYFAQPGRGTFERDGGGVLLTQAVHTLDVLLHLVGQAEWVTAIADNSNQRKIDTEDRANAAVRWKNGATGSIDATTLAFPGYPERIEIAGSEGSAVLEVESLNVQLKNGESISLQGSAAGGGGSDPMAFTHEHHRACIEEFLNAIDESREPLNSGRSALEVQKLIDAIIQSGKTHMGVTV
ncbi:oxidoreductase [Betaproteobacteria bacterium]|nr:oxidoreductase [Betaproteobacteria bacterium]